MSRKLHFDFGDMALALVLWMWKIAFLPKGQKRNSRLPLVALLIVPFFGLKVGAIIAAVLFFVAMAVWASKLASAVAAVNFSKPISERV